MRGINTPRTRMCLGFLGIVMTSLIQGSARKLLLDLVRDAFELRAMKQEINKDYSDSDLNEWSARLAASEQLVKGLVAAPSGDADPGRESAIDELNRCLSRGTDEGLFDEMAAYINPDVINAFCDAATLMGEGAKQDKSSPMGEYSVQGVDDGGRIISVSVRASDAFQSFYLASVARRDASVEWVCAIGRDGAIEYPGEGLVSAETVLEQPEVFSGIESVGDLAQLFDPFVETHRETISKMTEGCAHDLDESLSELLDDAAFELKGEIGALLANQVDESEAEGVIAAVERWVASEISNSTLERRIAGLLWLRGAKEGREVWDQCLDQERNQGGFAVLRV